MGAPTRTSDESPRDDYRGRHRTTEQVTDSAAAGGAGSDPRTEPLEGLIRAHGFTGRAGTVQI
jgi:hypothetical protein